MSEVSKQPFSDALIIATIEAATKMTELTNGNSNPSETWIKHFRMIWADIKHVHNGIDRWPLQATNK